MFIFYGLDRPTSGPIKLTPRTVLDIDLIYSVFVAVQGPKDARWGSSQWTQRRPRRLPAPNLGIVAQVDVERVVS